LGVLKTFLKDTVIYGLAIVLPRLINFLLVRLHTDVLPNEGYSENTEFYVVAAFFNVILTYGMETSFFRFFSKNREKNDVLSTAMISIVVSTFIFGILLLLFRVPISEVLRINTNFYVLLVGITLIDTLIVIPFAYLRVTGRPIKFASIKFINVLIIVLLNVLLLSKTSGSEGLQSLFSVENNVEYIFIANLIASAVVLILVLPYFFNHSDKENATQTYATILKYFTIVGALGLMIVVVYIDVLRSVFIKKESYLLALDIVPIVLLANLCLGIYHNLSIWYKLIDRTYFGMYISLVGAVITIGFNIIFIPIIGFMACAYATLLAYGLMMLISFILGRKYYPVPYDVSRIAIYLIISTLFSFVTYYLFDRNILLGTVFLLLFIALVVLLERKELKLILKNK
jgi:O-antigen/teichoic acid export membrane protein